MIYNFYGAASNIDFLYLACPFLHFLASYFQYLFVIYNSAIFDSEDQTNVAS